MTFRTVTTADTHFSARTQPPFLLCYFLRCSHFSRCLVIPYIIDSAPLVVYGRVIPDVCECSPAVGGCRSIRDLEAVEHRHRTLVLGRICSPPSGRFWRGKRRGAAVAPNKRGDHRPRQRRPQWGLQTHSSVGTRRAIDMAVNELTAVLLSALLLSNSPHPFPRSSL